jgi:plastocyanin
MRTRLGCAAGLALLAASTIAIGGPSGGSIAGKVTYQGTPAKQKLIDMSKEPSCAEQHPVPLATETVVVGPGNALQNVVVYISDGIQDETSPPDQAVSITQKGCQYIPHVLAIVINQELKVVNADQTSHNIHPLAKINREWNKSQPPGMPPFSESFEKPEFIPVKCNVHPWMHGTFAVLKNSHFAISGEDGSFTLPNLPPGKYTITAWHESYGEQTQEVSIAGNETQTVEFIFKAKPY